jgi:hypothetical protein
MHRKTLLAVLLLFFIALLTIGVANAEDTTYVQATFSVDRSTVLKGQTVTFTCTYTSGTYPIGTGQILICGPSTTENFDFLSQTPLYLWNGKTGSAYGPLLASGIPVTYTLQLNQTGYYQFEWKCNYNGASASVHGAYVTLNVHVVDTPTVLPEAPPLAVFALGFAAMGLFIVSTKKRSKQS